jgi:hypothetical protein
MRVLLALTLILVSYVVCDTASFFAVTSIRDTEFDVTFFSNGTRTKTTFQHKFSNPKRPILDSFYIYEVQGYFLVANEQSTAFVVTTGGDKDVFKFNGTFQAVSYSSQIAVLGAWVPPQGGYSSLVSFDPLDFSIQEKLYPNLPDFTKKTRAMAISEEAVILASSDDQDRAVIEVATSKFQVANSSCGYYWSLFYDYTSQKVLGTVSKAEEAPTNVVNVNANGTCEIIFSDLESVIKVKYGHGHFKLAGFYGPIEGALHVAAYDAEKNVWYMLLLNLNSKQVHIVQEYNDVSLQFARLSGL